MSLGGLPQESDSLGSAGGIILRVLYVLTVVLLATMGALIASRHAGNLIGWLCCIWGLLFALEMFASEYAASTALAPPGSVAPGAVWMAWLAQMLNIHIVLIVPVLLLFPDGHLPGPALGVRTVAGRRLRGLVGGLPRDQARPARQRARQSRTRWASPAWTPH